MNVKFNVTGFQPFGGDASNPTQDLLKYLQTCDPIEGITFNSLEIVDVSLGKVQQYFKTHSQDDVDVFIHIGVNGKAETFNLEKFGYNKMDFRIPDNDGN